ncbi:MAG: queuosine salvage family protein [Candidatus Woesearchaeota archaeon]
MNQILSEVKFVVDNSEHVKINSNYIKILANNFSLKDKVTWTAILPFKPQNLTKNERIAFNFVFNAINFSYWGNPKWAIKYQGKELDGSWAMIASIHRAIEEGYDILNPKYLINLNEEELNHIFRGNIEIPLFNERLKILKKLGKIVCLEFNNDFENVLKKSNYDCEKLLNVITSKFDFFNDYSTYKNKTIHFHKRAQLLIGDIYEILHKFKEEIIKNIDFLTAFADYKIPQILRKINVLKYSEELEKLIDNKTELEFGNSMEVEIRSNMIWAIELIKKEINKKFPNVNSMDIDHYLWILSQDKNKDDKPYHLTRTIFY